MPHDIQCRPNRHAGVLKPLTKEKSFGTYEPNASKRKRNNAAVDELSAAAPMLSCDIQQSIHPELRATYLYSTNNRKKLKKINRP